MGPELIKARHLPFAIFLGIGGYALARWVASPMGDVIGQLHQTITTAGVFFLVALPAIAIQYAENSLVWSHILDLEDNLSFYGLSLGIAVGLISYGLW